MQIFFVIDARLACDIESEVVAHRGSPAGVVVEVVTHPRVVHNSVKTQPHLTRPHKRTVVGHAHRNLRKPVAIGIKKEERVLPGVFRVFDRPDRRVFLEEGGVAMIIRTPVCGRVPAGPVHGDIFPVQIGEHAGVVGIDGHVEDGATRPEDGGMTRSGIAVVGLKVRNSIAIPIGPLDGVVLGTIKISIPINIDLHRPVDGIAKGVIGFCRPRLIKKPDAPPAPPPLDDIRLPVAGGVDAQDFVRTRGIQLGSARRIGLGLVRIGRFRRGLCRCRLRMGWAWTNHHHPRHEDQHSRAHGPEAEFYRGNRHLEFRLPALPHAILCSLGNFREDFQRNETAENSYHARNARVNARILLSFR